MNCNELINQLLDQVAAPDAVDTDGVVAKLLLRSWQRKQAVAKQQPRRLGRPRTGKTTGCENTAKGSLQLWQGGRPGNVAHRKALTVDQVEELSDSEIERLYARYSARLLEDMSKTISNAALGLYAGLVGMFVPIPDQPVLIRDLESDPFLSSALQGASNEFYHRYGM